MIPPQTLMPPSTMRGSSTTRRLVIGLLTIAVILILAHGVSPNHLNHNSINCAACRWSQTLFLTAAAVGVAVLVIAEPGANLTTLPTRESIPLHRSGRSPPSTR